MQRTHGGVSFNHSYGILRFDLLFRFSSFFRHIELKLCMKHQIFPHAVPLEKISQKFWSCFNEHVHMETVHKERNKANTNRIRSEFEHYILYRKNWAGFQRMFLRDIYHNWKQNKIKINSLESHIFLSLWFCLLTHFFSLVFISKQYHQNLVILFQICICGT